MNSPVRILVSLLVVWGIAATAAGALHFLAHVPPGLVPILVAAMTIGFSVALLHPRGLGEALRAVGLRAILAAHLVRFVGLYFLWLHAEGRLPAEFAFRAGWGDILAAAGALGLLAWPPGDGPWFCRALLAWNSFGAADLLVAVGTGGWLNHARPGSMSEMAGLPLTLVPLWLVPMLLASHLFLLCGGLRNRTPEATRPGGTVAV